MAEVAERAPGSKEAVLAALATLPRYYTDLDLVAALGSRDLLVEAYVQEWLPSDVLSQLDARPERLHCWLLARLARQGGVSR
jgi:hypothetical protein